MEEKAKKNKKIILIIILIILAVLAIATIGVYCYYNYLIKIEEEKQAQIHAKNDLAFIGIAENIEYGTSLTYEELLNKLINKEGLAQDTLLRIEINEKELNKDESYKFEEIGSYKIKITLLKEYEYKILMIENSKVIENIKELDIQVTDTKPPVLSGIKDREIMVGEDINLLEGIIATDEVDGSIEVKTEGEVDKNKAGEYIVKVKAQDRNGNITEQEYKVIVKEKKAEAKPIETKTNTKTKNTSNSNKAETTKGNTNSSNNANTKSGRLAIAKTEAKKIVGQIIKSGMSEYDKAKAIYNYLHNNVSTQNDQSNEAYKTNYGNEAYAALVLKKAACSGFCKAVTLMCDAAGLKSQHVNANKWIHQWNKVYAGGQWIIVDAQGGFFGGTEHPFADMFE